MAQGERLMRAGVGVLGAVVWWGLVAWLGGFLHGGWVAGVGLALWGALLVVLVGVVLGAKKSGPEDGMGRGCLWMVIWGVAGVMAVLGVSERLGWVWMVHVISLGGMFVGVMMGLMMVVERRAARRRRR